MSKYDFPFNAITNLNQFEQALEIMVEANGKTAPASLVAELAEIFDLQKVGSISSEDCDIEDYDNVSTIFAIEDKNFVILADSSERDEYAITSEYDSAMKIATDFCAR